MQKIYADDLADHDVIEEDSELVVGPQPAKVVTCGIPAVDNRTRQLGGSSFKDTSILGSAPVAAKVAQAISVPTPPLLASRCSDKSSHIYANGNPVIATASAARPASGVVRQPRTSAPSGLTSTSSESTPSSKSYHGGMAANGGEAATLPGGAEARVHGDILGGNGDDKPPTQPARPKSGGFLARFSSGRSLLSSSRPPSAKQDMTEAPAPKGQDGPAASPPTAAPCTVVNIRSSAIPCVDVDPQRRQLLRKLSVLDGPPVATVATNVFKAVPSGSRRQSHAGEQRCGDPADLEPPPAEPAARGAERRSSAGEGAAASGDGGVGPAGNPSSAAPDRPPTPLRRLSRMLSGSVVKPAALGPSSDQRDQDGAGANKGRSAGVAVRELFSRPSSARRKSEAGSLGGVAPQPSRMEAWKQQRPEVADIDDGPQDDRVQDFGAEVGPGRRPSSGILRRAASALAAALAR